MSDDLYNQIIQPNYTRLLQDVRPIDIVDLLHQYKCINADDMEKIDKRSQYSCHRDGMKALLNILRQKGSEAVRTFVSVLGESGYAHLEKKISENRPLPETMSTVLEKHSNRILQLEQKEAENKAEMENLKIQLSALKGELNVLKETKTQNEYRSQNQWIIAQMPVTQPNRNERELTPFEALLREREKKWLKERLP